MSAATANIGVRTEGERQLRNFEITNAVLAVLAVITTHLLAGTGPLLTGVLVGGAIGILNLRGMAWLGGKIRRAEKRSKGFYVALFGAKLALIMAAIWLALSMLPVAPLGVIIGFSTIVPASILMLFLHNLAPAAGAEKGTPQP